MDINTQESAAADSHTGRTELPHDIVQGSDDAGAAFRPIWTRWSTTKFILSVGMTTTQLQQSVVHEPPKVSEVIKPALPRGVVCY